MICRVVGLRNGSTREGLQWRALAALAAGLEKKGRYPITSDGSSSKAEGDGRHRGRMARRGLGSPSPLPPASTARDIAIRPIWRSIRARAARELPFAAAAAYAARRANLRLSRVAAIDPCRMALCRRAFR